MNKINRVVSLFAGIGGFDLGFINNGFDVIWANDFDKYAVESYKANISTNIILGDIRDSMYAIPEHDILIGGFPCQPFSTLGKLRGFDDERGTLFFVIKEIVKLNKPKIIVLENVRNLITHDKGNTMKKMVNELEELGYYVQYDVLNSLNFGLPQRRNRVFIIALKRDRFSNYQIEIPKGDQTKISALDILDKEVDIKYFISKKMIGTIMGEGTKGYIVKPTIDTPIAKTLTATMHKMHRASQDNYYTDDYNRNRFNDDSKTNIRKLTPNECRKLQGFPENWNQVVSNTQAYKQFGNAVSVPVSTHVAEVIRNHIKKYYI